MELEVQKFLRSGGTLSDLTATYAIKAKHNEALCVVALNYNQIASPMHEAICQECRALILDTDQWDVVSRSFFKFFNWGQPGAHEIDWATARVQEKVDGSLICFYFHRSEWRVATKGTPDASGPVNTSGMTFRALVERTLTEMGSSFADLTARLDPGLFYSFELTAPENRVIVPFAERRLTWLAAWDKATLAELDVADLPDLPTPRVREYPLRTLEEVTRAVEAVMPFSGEGVVVRDAAYRRVKVKSAAYVMIDRVLNTLSTPRRKVEAALSPSFDDMLPHLPDGVRDELLGIQAQASALRHEIAATFEGLRGLPDRKAFAAAALAYPYSAVLFWLYGDTDMDECFRRLPPDRLVDWLGLAGEGEAGE